MYIELLDNTRLLITLEREDLLTFDLEPYSISVENSETRSLLRQLLTLAAVKAGIPLKDKALAIEALPYDCGCFLLVTIKSKNKRKIYRIKTEESRFLAEFNTISDAFAFMEQVSKSIPPTLLASVYSDDERYYILFKSKETIRKSFKLSVLEFGREIPCNMYTESYLNEHCKLLCSSENFSKLISTL